MGNYLRSTAASSSYGSTQRAREQHLAQSRRAQRERQDQARIDEIDANRTAARNKEQSQTKRSQATQRARFAARGLNPNDGSAAAFLDGLLTEAEGRTRDADEVAELRKLRLRLAAEQREQDLLDREMEDQLQALRRLV